VPLQQGSNVFTSGIVGGDDEVHAALLHQTRPGTTTTSEHKRCVGPKRRANVSSVLIVGNPHAYAFYADVGFVVDEERYQIPL
jgi:hypothetical protein